MGVVFTKTPKGQNEIASRSGGLTPRVRRVLIMIDGKRSVDELRSMLQSDDLQHTLGMLEEDGFIEIASGSNNNKNEPLPSITAFSDLAFAARSGALATGTQLHDEYPECLCRRTGHQFLARPD